jgi:hypothetical protein
MAPSRHVCSRVERTEWMRHRQEVGGVTPSRELLEVDQSGAGRERRRHVATDSASEPVRDRRSGLSGVSEGCCRGRDGGEGWACS